MRRVGEAEAGRALIDVLQEWLSDGGRVEPPRARVRAAILGGAVRVQGAPARSPARRLGRGERIDAALREEALVSPARRADCAFEMGERAVLHRDRWLLAVNKPAGLPTHATADPARSSLALLVASYLGSGAYLAVHQRLDRETSGVVLFATDEAANAGLARAFAAHEVEKVYLALVQCRRQIAQADFTLAARLAAGRGPRVEVVGAGGVAAETRVRVLEDLERVALIEARPVTGRKHQIRAHLAHAGLPILGDHLYGATPVARVPAARCLLHAARLTLPHPVEDRTLRIEAPLPGDFTDALRAARVR